MFRIISSILILISLFLFTYYAFVLKPLNNSHNMEIILVTQKDLSEMEKNIKAAYESVLQEEGVPFQWITHGDLWRSTPRQILQNHRVLVFPDYLTEQIPLEFSVWVEDFIDLGGNVFIIYNCGTKSENGSYREKAVFTRLLGINYITYNKYKSLAFEMANICFKDAAAASFLEIPCGKMDENFALTGYQYGCLEYPIAKVEVNYIDQKDVMAYSRYEDGHFLPNTFLINRGKGNLMFANLPLGYLKAYSSDDLLLRTFLRAFLFRIAQTPHLCNTPYNKGGLVLNWHIDNFRERKNIVRFQKEGFFDKITPASFHVTAGDWVNEPGDDLGFDASKHPDLIRTMMEYGTIGSHGGWVHNWFAAKLEAGELSDEQIEYYIDLNSKVLSLTTNYDIREYAAPGGVHPQPQLTKILKKLGFTCYYYPGDSGSRPNRTFINGKMVSKDVIAFPVMPFHDKISVQELGHGSVLSQDYEEWLLASLEYLSKNKTIFLFYSHLYDFEDFPQYIKPFKNFLNRIKELESENKLEVHTMSFYADYLRRLWATDYKFVLRENLLSVELKNARGLEGISVAIPKNLCRKPPGSGFYIEEDEKYFYVNITEKVYEKNIICGLH